MIDLLLHKRFDIWLRDIRQGKGIRNPWIKGEYGEVYIRYSPRLFLNAKEWVQCIDLATINIYPKNQKKGIFKAFLAHVESRGLPIYIEQVINDNLESFLDKKSEYTKVTIGGIPQYYREGLNL